MKKQQGFRILVLCLISWNTLALSYTQNSVETDHEGPAEILKTDDDEEFEYSAQNVAELTGNRAYREAVVDAITEGNTPAGKAKN